MATYDVVIVGAGILGFAVARAILERRPGSRLAVLDKESAIGQHQTGHNSGVIHSGVYYAPGSLKAHLCVAGAATLTRYCNEHGIHYERCGKVIVATREAELPRLQDLYQRGMANGVAGLELIGPERLREIEPTVVGLEALWSPNTGIVDFSQVAASLAQEVESHGGEVLLGREVVGFHGDQSDRVILTSQGEITAGSVIACAGLYADRVAALAGAPRSPRIVPFRGDYYTLRPAQRDLVRGLIYPVPDPSFPFLGVHFTRRLDGEVWLGPNAVLAFAREGYRRSDVVLSDLLEALAFPGFMKLSARYWRTGLAELWRDFSKPAFLASLRTYVPALEEDDLLPGPSGVRAQALDDDGKLVDDFVVHRSEGMLHVRNAPSPAATSSLAIAQLIADEWERP